VKQLRIFAFTYPEGDPVPYPIVRSSAEIPGVDLCSASYLLDRATPVKQVKRLDPMLTFAHNPSDFRCRNATAADHVQETPQQVTFIHVLSLVFAFSCRGKTTGSLPNWEG
jgi:hypothetical protein